MTTISVRLEDRTLEWLRERSEAEGVTPEELVEDTLRRQESAERLLELTTRMSETAKERGLTEEKLRELLREDDEASDA